MPRVARKVFKGEKLFHVMVQGIKKEKIFLEEREKLEYIKLFHMYEKEFEIKVICYCIMDNHAHMLVDINEIANLTKFMHKLNTSYAIYYNKNKNRVGYVFRNRYKTQTIMDIKHLYNCVIYIHNNPVNAGICRHAKDYKYSSYKNYKSKKNQHILNEIFIDRYEYEKAHNRRTMEYMYFIDDEEGKEYGVQNDISYYLVTNNLSKAELRIKDDKLIPIVKLLKNKYSLSIRQIGNYLEIGREKIRTILNNN